MAICFKFKEKIDNLPLNVLQYVPVYTYFTEALKDVLSNIHISNMYLNVNYLLIIYTQKSR